MRQRQSGRAVALLFLKNSRREIIPGDGKKDIRRGGESDIVDADIDFVSVWQPPNFVVGQFRGHFCVENQNRFGRSSGSMAGVFMSGDLSHCVYPLALPGRRTELVDNGKSGNLADGNHSGRRGSIPL